MKLLVIIILFFTIHSNAKEFDKTVFEKTVKTIKDKTYYKISDDEIYRAALAGVLKHLESKNVEITEKGFRNDANALLAPRDAKEMSKDLKGDVTGIGTTIEYDKDKGQVYPIVQGTFPGSGAASAGIKRGDQVLKIDGEPVNRFKTFKDIIYRIRGKANTSVKLTLLRDGDILTKKVKRKKINLKSVRILEENKKFTVLKINYFNEHTEKALTRLLQRLAKTPEKPVVLDLRRNLGGLFDVGVNSMKLFAKKGETVLKAKYAKGQEKKFVAEQDGLGRNLKLIVLIGDSTKSIAEGFAAALQRMNGATIVGEKSFGKGTMETVMGLDNDYSVKFTIGRLFSPDGSTWDKTGLSPDIEVAPPAKPTEKDPQLDIAKKLASSMAI